MIPPPLRVRRVAVASDHSLIAEAVGAALSSRGFEVRGLAWPTAPGAIPAVRMPVPDVGLLMCELEPERSLVTALKMADLLPVPWLLLTGTPPGPSWGAMIDAGIDTIRPSSVTLDDLVVALDGLAEGRHALPVGVRRRLQREWRAHQAEQDDLRARMASLTPRERSVLALLYAGDTVRTIAELYEVSEATVRSQVRSVLRKLGVNSQLAAVAAYASVRAEPDRPSNGASQPAR
jgi:two-component system nitrate/nitrite response regulator NarL